MENIDLACFIFLVGCSYASYIIGKREGIGATLDYMMEHGNIDFED